MITRTDVLAHLERNMRVGFLNGSRAYTPMRAAFTEETSSDGAFETYADMGDTPWPIQNGGQAAGTGTDPRTGAQQVGGLHDGGPITILGTNERALIVFNQDWQIPIGITHSAIDDQRVGNLEDWGRNAGMRYQQHMDHLAFSALNAGEGSTYGLAYDGLTFFNDSHVDPSAQYQTAQDNKYALALSVDNFDTVYIAGASFRDDRGQPIGVFHNLLVHSINLTRMASQITDNPMEAGTGNNDINPWAGTITRLAAPGGWLDTTAWFLVNTMPGMKPLGLQVRMQPRLITWDDYSQGSGVRYFKWEARYTIFYRNWRMAIQGNT